MEELSKTSSFLKVEGITKNFGELQVLKGIDFTVQKGEVVAILGSSGSGKTTLLRCLNFLETSDSGRIIVDDEVLFDGDDKGKKASRDEELRKKRLHFGLVFQSFNLFPQYTVKKNIELASILQAKERLKDKKVMDKKALKEAIIKTKAEQKEQKTKLTEQGDADKLKALKSEQANTIKELKQNNKSNIAQFMIDQTERVGNIADQLLIKVGLSDKAKSYPCELSGGQQQRVAIARALALSPDILCFDEPTSALDPELTGEVLKVIKGLKSDDTTMIIVTHEMEFAKNVADKIIFMADGVIAEIAEPKRFFDNPTSCEAKAFLSKSLEEI